MAAVYHVPREASGTEVYAEGVREIARDDTPFQGGVAVFKRRAAE